MPIIHPSSETCQPRHRGRRSATAVALVSAAFAATAGSASADVFPSGGGFTPPVQYATSGSCGALCTVSATPVSVSGNSIMQTSYQSLLGVLGNSNATETLSSPTFTWTGATPAQAALSFQYDANLGGLLGSVDPTIAADLVNNTTGVSTQLDTVAIPNNLASMQNVTAPVSPGLITSGDQLQLRLVEGFTNPAGIVGAATLGLDNVGLDITPAANSTSSTGGGGSGGGGSSSGAGATNNPGSGSGSGAGATSGGGSGATSGPTHAGARCLVLKTRTSPICQRLLRLTSARVTPRHPLRVIASPRATKHGLIRYRLGGAHPRRVRHHTITVGYALLHARHRLTITVSVSRPAHPRHHVRLSVHATPCP